MAPRRSDPSKLPAPVFGAVQTGALGGSFGAAAPGTGVAIGNFTYSEVGYFNFGVDGVRRRVSPRLIEPNDCTNDFSNTLATRKVRMQIRKHIGHELFRALYP